MTHHLAHKLSLLAAIGLATLIYYLSDRQLPHVIVLFNWQDKVIHAIVYGLLGFLVLGAMRIGQRGYSAIQAGIAVGLTTLYGILDEFHQSFVPGRMADTWDVLADATGAVLGVYLLYALSRLYKNRNR
jgi:VanZ family protein